MNFNYNLQKSTGISFCDKKNFIEKFYFSTNKKNLKYFKNEYEGYKWYLSNIDNKALKNLKILKKNKKINSLRIPIFEGKKYKFWKNFLNKKDLIETVVKHYRRTWSENKKIVPYHGDLTLSNVIFLKNKKIRFIDWEFFEKKQPWGLDICNFFISLIALPALAKKNNYINDNDCLMFNFYWKSFFNNHQYEYLESPIKFLKKKTKLSNKNYLNKLSSKLEKKITYLVKNANK